MVRNIQTGYAKWKLDSRCTPGQEDTYLGAKNMEKVKVAQLCLTLFDTMNYIVQGILQARILEWVAFPFSRDLPNPGSEPRSPILQVDTLPAEPQGKPKNTEGELQVKNIKNQECE